MTTNPIVQSYLFFEGKCEEALDFYRRALGAEVQMLMRYKDSPDQSHPGCGLPPGSENKIMHVNFRIGDTQVMASDGHCSGKPNFDGFSLSLTVKTDPEADHAFKALSEGGQVVTPLAKTFFSSKFGMVTDRFGIMWMVLVMP